jgi:ribosome recycling factor
MTHKEIIQSIRPELDKVVDFVQKKLMSMRSGRVSPALVEDIKVDYFGQTLTVKQLASITVINSRELLIQPWDQSYSELLYKAVEKERSGLSVTSDKTGIRVSIPPISEEFKKEFIRTVAQIENDAKKTIRKFRDEAWSNIQKETLAGTIREDDKFRAKDELQDLVDEYNKKVDELIERKKQEINQ